MRQSFIGNCISLEDAQKIFHDRVIWALEAANCEPTNRLIDFDEVEFSASIYVRCSKHEYGSDFALITAYYYQDKADLNCDDMGFLDWEIDCVKVDWLDRVPITAKVFENA